jgi:hypothetical protein
MKIHNVYSDILLYLGNSINNVLDQPIKNFQYNIGNASFTIEYDPNYELPAAIINYTGSQFHNARPDTFLRRTGNINQLPVLYNHTKHIGLIIQEDLFVVNIDFVINCNSQLEAIQFKHQLENHIPPNKYLQFYKFVSYYNLEGDYLNPFIFDVVNDSIENLFYKHDQIKDNIEYCYAVSYYPLVKLTNSSINLSGINSSSYGLNLSFELLIQLPSSCFLDITSQQQRFYVDNNQYDQSFTLNYPNILLPLDNDKVWVEFNNNQIYNYSFDNNNDLYLISDHFIITKKSIEHSYIVRGIINDKIINHSTIILNVGNKNKMYGSIDGSEIVGNVFDVEIDNINNRIKATFEGQWLSNYSKFNIDLEYQSETVNYQLDNINIVNLPTNITEIVSYRYIPVGLLKDKILTVNKSRTELNPNHNIIKKIIFKDETELELDIRPLYDPNKKRLIYNFIYDNNNITIIADQTTCKFIDQSNLISQILINGALDYYPIRNIGKIEKINYNLQIYNQVISTIAPIELSYYHPECFNLIIDNIIAKRTNDYRYEFKIKLPYYNKLKVSDFKFYFSATDYVSSKQDLKIILDIDKSLTNQLYFSTTESFYIDQFSKINKINPLFFTVLGNKTHA